MKIKTHNQRVVRRAPRLATFVRDVDGGTYTEIFLLSAVATVLVIRWFLYITGYPQVGNGTLHIAHMLYGGLLMLLALLALLSFLDRRWKFAASLMGGIGFGLFIDELGKFVTQDNDYFYQPAVALIYAVFILIFLGTRVLQRNRGLSQSERLLNALSAVERLAVGRLDAEGRQRALHILDECDPAHALVPDIRRILLSTGDLQPSQAGWWERNRDRLVQGYRSVLNRAWLGPVIAILFALQGLSVIGQALTLTFVRDNIDPHTISFVEAGDLIASAAVGLFVLRGLFLLRGDRLLAYQAFERSVLISIFFSQLFAFARDQLAALGGLAFHLILLAALQFLIWQEETSTQAPAEQPAAHPAD